MTRVPIMLTGVALGTGLLCVNALAQPSGHARVHRDASRGSTAPRFDGHCQFSGVVQFVPPMTNTPQPVTDIADAKGTCSGTLSRSGHAQTLNDAAVEYVASDHGDSVTCAEGVAIGGGYLQFGSDHSDANRIYFDLEENRLAALATLVIQGTDGGQGGGEAHVNQNADPVATLGACSGAGLAEAPVDLNLVTSSPLAGRQPESGGLRVQRG